MISIDSIRKHYPEFTAEADAVTRCEWDEIVNKFLDANIFQTWAYGTARTDQLRLSHLVLKRAGNVVAAVQARLVGFPSLRIGVAYIRWGPIWNLRSGGVTDEVFRQAIRAIRNEYTVRRGLVVRLLPPLCTEENEPYTKILAEEGLEMNTDDQQYRTIIMDARPSLEELERGFHPKWRKNLNRARKSALETIQGQDIALLESLGMVYAEMVQRKQFSGQADIENLIRTQRDLPANQKMTVILCKAEGEIVAGTVFSVLGNTAVDLFRATSNRGTKTYGSYLLQWHVLEELKKRDCQYYNLNGINPERNPGGYQFKSQLAGKNGREVTFVGTFDAYPNNLVRLAVTTAQQFRARLRRRNDARADKARTNHADSSGSPSGREAPAQSSSVGPPPGPTE